ncbi:MAG: DUF87 domain-containing protein, partial [Nitrospirales bacterium]
QDLSKHMLVVGTTGSGKTTTCLNLLAELASHGIPFLVIEPVNAEHDDYRSLLRLPDLADRLQVFTLGDEETAPFRLNPFEIQRGITVNEHISSMLTAFKAAIPMWEPLPRLFLKALVRTYYRKGWTAFKKPQGLVTEPVFPTMQDFYRELSRVIDTEVEHEGEVKGNIRGASKLRIEALLEGSCGRILTARRSLALETWMERPTILELKHIGDDEDKALMIAFILMSINEYLEKGRKRDDKDRLQHVTLIEEAHRLLGKTDPGTSPEQSNTKGQAAEAFARALAENRKYGEGIIIAEQLPTKLVTDAIGNTGLKVMHRLTSADDREELGRAMKFNEFQQEFVTAMRAGQAAIYGLDIEEPTLIQASDYWSDWESKGFPVQSAPVTDGELRDLMLGKYPSNEFLPHTGCELCPAPCQVRDHGESLLYDKSLDLLGKFVALCSELSPEDSSQMTAGQLVDFCYQAVNLHSSEQIVGVRRKAVDFCLFVFLKEASGLFGDHDPLLWESYFRTYQDEFSV